MPENFLIIFFTNLAIIMGFMTLVWVLSVIMKNASIVDIFWGLGFIFISLINFIRTDGFITRNILILILVGIWGLRLAVYIFIRNKGKGEDPRYQNFRKKYGKNYWIISLFQVFYLQSVLLWIVSTPIQIGQASYTPAYLIWSDFIGIGIWLIGFLFETIGDIQLAIFKSKDENKGKVFDKGLWKYTRHPNYFGESLIWWGIFFIAVSTPYGIYSIISPILITFLLLRVSGVTMLEKGIKKTKPEYEDYIKKTSSFFPWFPKK